MICARGYNYAVARHHIPSLKPKPAVGPTLLIVTSLAVCSILPFCLRSRSIQFQLIERSYIGLHEALQSQDSSKARQLIAPKFRSKKKFRTCAQLRNFVEPFTDRSSIILSGDRGFVYPDSSSATSPFNWTTLFGGPPTTNGSYLTLEKLNGTWFFTGEIHID